MIKTLTRLGNSSALILDKTMMDLMGIDGETPLKISIDGRKMTVEPLGQEEREVRFQRAMKKTGRKNAELFKRLAK